MSEEEKYESIELTIKARSTEEGESWFDVIHDFLTANCTETFDENGDINGCTCGLQSMGGFTGTLDQCYEHQRLSENWATVKSADLKMILLKVAYMGLNDEEREAFNRLKEEAYWHDNFQEWLDNLPDEEEEECECIGEARCPEHFLSELDEEEFELDEEFKPYFSNEPLPKSIEQRLMENE